MTAVLAVRKCGCRRPRCARCGKVVTDLPLERCGRHSQNSFVITGTDTVSICRACATRPAWPPPHANWKKARP